MAQYGQATTNALLTEYTPPASCFTGPWTAAAGQQNVFFRQNNENCQPVLIGQAAYSPGICPSGFTTANATVSASSTFGACCPTDYSLTAHGTLCTSTATAPVNGECFYPANAAAGAACNAGTAPSGAEFIVNGIEVVYRQADLTLFPAGYTPSPVPTSSTSKNSTVQNTSSAAPGSHHHPPVGAFVGLAVGIVVLLLLVAGAIYFLCVVRKNRGRRGGGIGLGNPQRRSVNEGESKMPMDSEVELVEEHNYSRRP